MKRLIIKYFIQMKTLLLTITILFATLVSVAQTDGMSYQAVIVDNNEQEIPGVNVPASNLPNVPLEVQFSIINNNNAVEYRESHVTETDAYGMIHLMIGQGEPTVGAFNQIYWNDEKFLKVDIDLFDGNGLTEFSYQGLTYIPYVKHREIIATSTLDVDGATTLNNTLYVEGATNLNNTLDVEGATNLNNTLTVQGATHLYNTLDVEGATSLNNTLDVQDAAHLNSILTVEGATQLNNTLDVSGVTNINNHLTVGNGSPTHLTGDLTVDGMTNLEMALSVGGDTQLDSDLIVSGNTLLEGDLTVLGATNFGNATFENITVTEHSHLNTLEVDGITNMNNAFHVNNTSPANFSGNLQVEGITSLNENLFVNALSNLNGQVTINAGLTGGQSSYAAYPLRVEGSPQGIAVRLTAGTPNNDNNFITFFNAAGNAVGRIEGETIGEVATSPEFIFQNAIYVAEEIKSIAAIPIAAIPVVTVGTPVTQAGPCTPCILLAAAELVLATANLVAYNVFALTNLGVSYQSGSADYAEWLKRRHPQEIITAGDIVGIDSGKISKLTTDAQKLLVISTKPAVLGNMPSPGDEHLYEKVAFMGQIPVKVRGVVLSGDYILPSGKNDGTGIAVSPEDIKADQFKHIVGVAWSSSYVDSGVTLVNMAIGLNTNDVADLVAHQEAELKRLKDQFQSLEQRVLAMENGTTFVANDQQTQEVQKEKKEETKALSKHDALLATMPKELDDTVMKEAIAYLKQQYEIHGVDVKNHPGLDRLFSDEVYQQEIIKKAQDVYRKSYKSVPGSN